MWRVVRILPRRWRFRWVVATDAVFIYGVVSEPTSIATSPIILRRGGEIFVGVRDEAWGWKALTLTYGFEERMYGVAQEHGNDQACTVTDEMYPRLGIEVFQQSSVFWNTRIMPKRDVCKHRFASIKGETSSIKRKYACWWCDLKKLKIHYFAQINWWIDKLEGNSTVLLTAHLFMFLEVGCKRWEQLISFCCWRQICRK
jgi:hypothetical protein